MRRPYVLAFKLIIINLITFCRSEELTNFVPLLFREKSKNKSGKEKDESKIKGNIVINENPTLSKVGNQCFKNSNCYECASMSECYWCNKTRTCDNYLSTTCNVSSDQYVKNSEVSDFWFLNFYYMCDPISRCGNRTYDLLSGKVNLSAYNNLGIYQGCYWIIQNTNLKNYSYSLERLGPGRDKVAFANFLSSNNYTYQFDSEINSTKNYSSENFYAKIIFYQYFDTHLNNSFKMEIIIDSSEVGNSILRICVIIIGSLMGALVVLFCLRCILVNCCFRRAIGIDDTIVRLQPEIALEVNEANIEEIITNFQEASIEECKNTGQINCTVCLLPNEGKEKIISLPCHHYFHFNCITNWVRRKNIKPTCPNCNYDLLSNKEVPIPTGFFKNDKENKPHSSNTGINKVINTFDGQSRNHTDYTSEENKNSNVKVRDQAIDSFPNDFQTDLNSTHNKFIVNVKKNPTPKSKIQSKR